MEQSSKKRKRKSTKPSSYAEFSEWSESGTSGSSFKPDKSEEDTDSSIETSSRKRLKKLPTKKNFTDEELSIDTSSSEEDEEIKCKSLKQLDQGHADIFHKLDGVGTSRNSSGIEDSNLVAESNRRDSFNSDSDWERSQFEIVGATTDSDSSCASTTAKRKKIDPSIKKSEEKRRNGKKDKQEELEQRSGHFFLSTKVDAVKRLKNGESKEKIAKEFGAHLGTVQRWYRDFVKKGKPIQSEKYKKSKVYSREQMLEACELLKQGHPTIYVAKKFGVARSTVQCWRHKYAPESWTDRRISWKFDNDKILKACSLLKQGHSIANVAKKVGVSREALQQWRFKYLKEFKDTKEDVGKYDKCTMLKACTQLRQGASMEVVAEELNVHIDAVRKWAIDNFLLRKQKLLKDSKKFDRSLINNVCKETQQGVSPYAIANKYGISATTVYRWREKYLAAPKNKVIKDGWKYNKKTVIKACKLLKQGISAEDVAKKLEVNVTAARKWNALYVKGETPNPTFQDFNSYSRFVKDGLKYKRNTKLEACKLLKRGWSTRNVANKLNVPFGAVSVWRIKYLYGRSNYKDPKNVRVYKYNKRTILKVYNLLKRGYEMRPLSRRLGIARSTIIKWNRRFIKNKKPEISVQTLLKIGLYAKDAKLMGDPVVVLTRDPKIDERCRETHIGRRKTSATNRCLKRVTVSKSKEKKLEASRTFIPLRKVHIPTETKLQLVKMINKGVSTKLLSSKLNINELVINSWVLNQEVLEKCGKLSA